jgi:hypothetical protein
MISTRRFQRIAVFGWLAAAWPAYAASLVDAVNAARGFDAEHRCGARGAVRRPREALAGAGRSIAARADRRPLRETGHFASLFTLEPLEWGKRFAPCEDPPAAAPRVPCHADS